MDRMSSEPRTLAEKIWDAHVVRSSHGEPDLLYIDLHLVHEVTSPQAFDGLRAAGRKVRPPDLTIATEDHNVPTTGVTGPNMPLTGPDSPVTDPVSRTQIEAMRKNAAEFGIRLHPMGDAGQGIVHVIGPQFGLTQPGMTIVCGDSHTSTHGALGALAFGIGTSEVEHVLATQTLPQIKPKTMAVNVEGALPDGVTAKDLILAIIGQIGTGGGQGYVIEYRGEAIRSLSMEGRLTVCNMSIEAGARAGLVAPGEVTFEYLKGRQYAPQGADWDAAVAYWSELETDEDAVFDHEVTIDATVLTPYVTWGTNPGQALPLGGTAPAPGETKAPTATARAGLGRGAKRDLHRGRGRMAQRRVLEVPGHEPGHAQAGGAVRLDLEQELRGPPGQGRAHPPGVTRRRRRHRRHRPAVRAGRPVGSRTWNHSSPTPAARCRCGAPTWTPTRSSRPCTSSGSPATGSATGSSRPGGRTRRSCSTSPVTPAPPSWWRAGTSAPVRRARRPSGPCSTTASGR